MISLDWTVFGLGVFGAAVLEFLRFNSGTFGPRKQLYPPTVAILGVPVRQFSYLAVVTSVVYVVIGGAFTAIMAPTTVPQAVALGAGWQIAFGNLVGTEA